MMFSDSNSSWLKNNEEQEDHQIIEKQILNISLCYQALCMCLHRNTIQTNRRENLFYNDVSEKKFLCQVYKYMQIYFHYLVGSL